MPTVGTASLHSGHAWYAPLTLARRHDNVHLPAGYELDHDTPVDVTNEELQGWVSAPLGDADFGSLLDTWLPHLFLHLTVLCRRCHRRRHG